jgi:hypothetical protein
MAASLAAAISVAATILPALAVTPRPAASISPKTIRVGRTGILNGNHFKSGEFWFFLVAVPNLQKPKSIRFIAESQPARNGTVRIIVHIPLEPACGKAGIYAYSTTSQKWAIKVGTVTLTGCKAAPKPGLPPLAPGGGTKPPKPPGH